MRRFILDFRIDGEEERKSGCRGDSALVMVPLGIGLLYGMGTLTEYENEEVVYVRDKVVAE